MATTTTAAALDGTVHHLDPRIRTVWAISGSVPWLILGAAGATAAAIGVGAALAGAVAVAAVVALVATVATVRWRWRCWSWSATADALELEHGALFRRTSIVPYHRIQQIDIHRDPVDRLLGLSKLILRTAAATSDATLPGIAHGDAEGLRHELLRRSGHDDAV